MNLIQKPKSQLSIMTIKQNRHLKTLLKLTIIVLTSTTLYWETIQGTFVFDDLEAVKSNRDVLLDTNVSDVFRHDFWGTSIISNKSHKSYRPVTVLWFRLNTFLGSTDNPDPHVYHFTSVLLYALCCSMTFFVFREILGMAKKFPDFHKTYWFLHTDFIATIIFTVHPIHTEVVAAIVGQADLLSAVFFCATFLTYTKWTKVKASHLSIRIIYACLILAFSTLATFSKETGITVLAVCSAYDFLHTFGTVKKFLVICQRDKVRVKRFVSRQIAIFMCFLTIMYVRLWVMNFEKPVFQPMDNPASFSGQFWTRVLTFNYVYFLNGLLLVWPQWLCFDWAMGCIPLVEGLNDFRVVFVVVLWLTVAFVVKEVHFRADFKILTMCFAMIVITFLPSSNIIQIGFVVAERSLFLPSMGYSLLVAIGSKKLLKLRMTSPYILFTFTVVAFVLKSQSRGHEWLEQETLYKSALNVCPLNAKVHYNIAKMNADHGDGAAAEREYREAIRLYENYDQALNNLANLLKETGRFDESEILLRRAIRVRPDFAAAWMNLGIVLTHRKKYRDAELAYLTAIRFRTKYADCYFNLGNLYLEQKRNQEALTAWQEAIHLRPKHTLAWNNILVLLDNLGETERAIRLGREAIQLQPHEASLHFTMANNLGKRKYFHEAEYHFLTAISLNPRNAVYYSNLGVLYHRWEKKSKAEDYYRRALKIDPHLPSAKDNLRKLKS